MLIYVVLPAPAPLDQEVMNLIEENNRYRLDNGVWFIRSNLDTSSEVAKALGIDPTNKGGIVVATSRYDGVADRGLVEKLTVWEQGQ